MTIKVELRRYRTMASMEPEVRGRVQQMGGDPNRMYHLLNVAHNRYGFSLRRAMVIMVSGKAVAWGAFYNDGPYLHAGFWTMPEHRKKGYGTQLMREAYRYWRRYNPEVHLKAHYLWNQWDDDKLK